MSTSPIGTDPVRSLAVPDGRARLEGGVGGMDNEACGTDGDLVRGIIEGQADEGDAVPQLGEERGERVGVGGAERLPIAEAQELWPGPLGGETVGLRAVAEVSEVAAEHEWIDLVHPE